MARKKKERPVPDELVIVAANKTQKMFGKGTGSFTEKEATWLREQLPKEYWHVETDYLRQRSETLRKDNKIEPMRTGRGQPTQEELLMLLSPKYREYIASDFWREKQRPKFLQFWGHACVLCGSQKDADVHHRFYDRLGHEEITDCVVLCRKCHKRHHKWMHTADDETLLPLSD